VDKKLVYSKWLNKNEDIACRKIISSTNVTKTKTIGKYYLKLNVNGDQQPPPPPFQSLSGS
jgi:hypothetical protein